MEDQIAMTLLGVMEQDMSILTAEEAGSSSILRVKHHRRYVNCDHEAAHLRLHHDYFNDDCDYPPHHTSVHGTICSEVFSYTLCTSLVKPLRISLRGMMELVILA
jgi:hypothetical protein